MKRKLLSTVLILTLLLSACGTSISESDVTIEKKKWVESGAWSDYNKMGLLITNSSDTTIDIEITAECYDKNYNYLDKRHSTIYALGPNTQYLMNVSLDGDIADITYDYKCSKSRYKAIYSPNISASFYVDNGSGYITVTNNSDTDIEKCNCTIVFYDDSNNIIEANTVSVNNGNIPSGKKATAEVDYPHTGYNTEEIYINAYKR